MSTTCGPTDTRSIFELTLLTWSAVQAFFCIPSAMAYTTVMTYIRAITYPCLGVYHCHAVYHIHDVYPCHGVYPCHNLYPCYGVYHSWHIRAIPYVLAMTFIRAIAYVCDPHPLVILSRNRSLVMGNPRTVLLWQDRKCVDVSKFLDVN